MNKIEPLLQSCNILTGIGSHLLEKLHRLNIFSIYDLLLHLPFRYQDRTRITAIRDLVAGQYTVVQGTIIESHWLKSRKKIYHCCLHDGSGRINLRFFHMPAFQQKRLQLHSELKIYGEVKQNPYGFEMIHPELEQSSAVDEFFTPCYHSTQGLNQSIWRKLIKQVFEKFQPQIAALEWLSELDLQQAQFMSLYQALHLLHFPTPEYHTEALLSPLHPARLRLAFEELVAFSLSNQLLKQHTQQRQAFAYSSPLHLDIPLLQHLPFQLTQAQQKVIQEIRQDLNRAHPMLRLLQGDVGSGKTIVCALSALPVLAQHHQVALMAPTDLLSEQHYINMKKWLEPLGFHVGRLNRTTPNKEKKRTLNDLTQGHCQLVVGTHALFQDKVQFQQLGLVIIDEQHRFGVVQRLRLIEKANQNHQPHQLFVTATPIPRTLAMTQFSHFDASIIDQLPAGRKPIHTAVMPQDRRDEIIDRLQKVLDQGGQIYWVCTRIEEDEQDELLATEALLKYLIEQLPHAKIASVHGQLKGVEKDRIMTAFKQGEFNILVATTVIEVGVDVPNANIMIIENAERLGLSQLHQLRGRVGRGTEEAYCILMYNQPLSETTQKRLHIIRHSTDGFYLAEQDLLIRGAGDMFGTRQTGFMEFRLAQIPQHLELLKQAQHHAHQILVNHSPVAETLLSYWYPDSQKYLNA